MKRFFFLFLVCSLSIFATAQIQLSEQANISLLTCSPGDDLYNTFGHSAIRVVDTENDIDIVFNYGTFSFGGSSTAEQIDFGVTFARGQLLYWVSIADYNNFVASYYRQQRWVFEQVLNLTLVEKQALYNTLIENAKEENKYYRYDFFFDNCSSRIRDIFEAGLGNVYGEENSIVHQPTDKSFIDLIHPYIEKSPWLDFGIDIILGVPSSKKASPYEYMFLPDFLMSETDKADNLVLTSHYIVPFDVRPINLNMSNGIFTPVLCFSILFLIILAISIVNFKRKKHWYFIDRILLLVTGVCGCLFMFMGLGTDHLATHYNLNMLWAFPLNIIALFFVKNQKSKLYFKIILGLAILNLLGGWLFLPQDFHIAVIPILLILIVRSLKNIELKNLK